MSHLISPILIVYFFLKFSEIVDERKCKVRFYREMEKGKKQEDYERYFPGMC